MMKNVRGAPSPNEPQSTTRRPRSAKINTQRMYTGPPPPHDAVSPSAHYDSDIGSTAASQSSSAAVSNNKATPSSHFDANGRVANRSEYRRDKDLKAMLSPSTTRSSKKASGRLLSPRALSTSATLSPEKHSVTSKAKGWLRRLSNSDTSETSANPNSSEAVLAPKVPTRVSIDWIYGCVSKTDIEKELMGKGFGFTGVAEFCDDDFRNYDYLIGAWYNEWQYAEVDFDSKEGAEKAVKHLRKNGVGSGAHGKGFSVKPKIIKPKVTK